MAEIGRVGVENNGFNKNKKEPESIKQWKQKNRDYLNSLLKGSSAEISAAAGYGGSAGINYAGDGKVNVSGAVITGWSVGASVNKSWTQGDKADGLYTEVCASGKLYVGATACFGASANKTVYATEKLGVGIGGRFGTAIGYSKTYQIFPISKKIKKKDR